MVQITAFEVEKANVVQLANVNSITAAQRTQHYELVGVPAYVKLDTTDNLLNPTTAYRAQLAVTRSHAERLGDNGENAAQSLGLSRA